MDDPRIFGLGNFFGLALRHSIEALLCMFTRPQAYSLPISVSFENLLSWLHLHFAPQVNGFNTFLNHQAATEMVFHIVFRTTATNRIRLVMADLEPMTFRSAAYPPADTLALVGSCVGALSRLSSVLLTFMIPLVLSVAPHKAHKHVGC